MIHLFANRSCRWCWQTISNSVDTCERCTAWLTDRERKARWWNQRHARVEVLSVCAEEIVRSNFSKRAIRDDFKFCATGPMQLELGRWTSIKMHAGYVLTRAGRYVELWERADVWVPFTLKPNPDVEKYAQRYWGAVMKVAKAGGVLRTRRGTVSA